MVSLSVPSITGHHSPRHNHPSHNRPPVYDIIISQTQSLFVPRSTQIHNHETISNPVTMLPDKVTSKQHSEDTTQNDVISIDFPAPSGWTKREVKNTVQVLEDVKGIPDLTNSSLIEGRWRLMFTTRSGTASPIQVLAYPNYLNSDFNLQSPCSANMHTNCPQQHDDWQCDYYVMMYMRQIIKQGLTDDTMKKAWCDSTPYLTDELDEIREVLACHTLQFLQP